MMNTQARITAVLIIWTVAFVIVSCVARKQVQVPTPAPSAHWKSTVRMHGSVLYLVDKVNGKSEEVGQIDFGSEDEITVVLQRKRLQ